MKPRNATGQYKTHCGNLRTHYPIVIRDYLFMTVLYTEHFRSLRQLLDKEMLESANLRLQVDDLKKDRASSEEAHLASVQALSR